MKKNILRNAIVATWAAAVTLGAGAAPMTYTMDPAHTEVVASWDHFGFSNPAAIFYEADGSLTYDAQNPQDASVEVTIPISSMHTTLGSFTKHLQSSEFFDADKYPTSHFKSTAVEAGAEKGQLKVKGDLTIHGVTKPVAMNVTVNRVDKHPMYEVSAAGFNGTVRIKRSDFGIDAFVPMVSDEVDLRITVEAIESEAWKKIAKQAEAEEG